MIGLDVTHQALFRPPPTVQLSGSARGRRDVFADLLSSTVGSTEQRYGWDGSPIHERSPSRTRSGPASSRRATWA